MGGERRTRVHTVPSHNVENTFRQFCLLRNYSKLQTGERRKLGWLENDGAASSKCGCDLPHRHQQRVIPWCDERSHSHWLSSKGSAKIGVRHFHCFALPSIQLFCHVRIVIKAGCSIVNIPQALFERLATVHALDNRETVRALANPIRNAAKVRGALMPSQVRPDTLIESLSRSCDSKVDVTLITRRYVIHASASGGIGDLHHLACSWPGPHPIAEVAAAGSSKKARYHADD
mmetsp:Transcript_33583/g.85993  ORF Transcript_33583/g.85993 Transcript_33583/m.85993 type:complete len:232 (+) Transcript_33583:991-1686(+)